MRNRIVETNEGIQGSLDVEVFDAFARGMRDRHWNNVDALLEAGLVFGKALEIGPGPGYVGLEWLKHTEATTLTGCEISKAMIEKARQNAAEYGFLDRVAYVQASGLQMPFADNSFDAVFSNGSLHEWEDPVQVLDEIHRVLKNGGRFCIADMRRDVSPLKVWCIKASTKPKAILPGFKTSLQAAYTIEELRQIVGNSVWKDSAIFKKEFFGLCVSACKNVPA
jgi:ubiquinone/menaquinone biosynthesis C-methylase UbiE